MPQRHLRAPEHLYLLYTEFQENHENKDHSQKRNRPRRGGLISRIFEILGGVMGAANMADQ